MNLTNCINNCVGAHVATSRECPVKICKILEKKNKNKYADVCRHLILLFQNTRFFP